MVSLCSISWISRFSSILTVSSSALTFSMSFFSSALTVSSSFLSSALTVSISCFRSALTVSCSFFRLSSSSLSACLLAALCSSNSCFRVSSSSLRKLCLNQSFLRRPVIALRDRPATLAFPVIYGHACMDVGVRAASGTDRRVFPEPPSESPPACAGMATKREQVGCQPDSPFAMHDKCLTAAPFVISVKTRSHPFVILAQARLHGCRW